tara:strand:+ start:385 stop:720 length:336 start_codon:yes stop_codon:yes gene_type:complete
VQKKELFKKFVRITLKNVTYYFISWTGFSRFMSLEADPSVKFPQILGQKFEVLSQSIPLLSVQIINNNYIDVVNKKLKDVNYSFSAFNLIDFVVELVLERVISSWQKSLEN